MEQYHDLLKLILKNGEKKIDRTGVGTLSHFAHQMRFNLQNSFPLITTKKVHFKSVVHELLWFIRGETNIHYLKENGVSIWDEWADTDGNLGPIYGKQWRAWPTADGKTIDQLAGLIHEIRENKNSRRLIVSAWNVGELEKMALPPCHLLFQFYVSNQKLSCQVYQRSADVFLGVPFNIASYALLTCMVAQQCDLFPGELIWTGGDCHLYLNHIDQVHTQLARVAYPEPQLELNRAKDLFSYSYEDIQLLNYRHHPTIKAPIAV